MPTGSARERLIFQVSEMARLFRSADENFRRALVPSQEGTPSFGEPLSVIRLGLPPEAQAYDPCGAVVGLSADSQE